MSPLGLKPKSTEGEKTPVRSHSHQVDDVMLNETRRWRFAIILWISASLLVHIQIPILGQETPPIVPVSQDTLPSYSEAVEAHLGYVTDYSLDEYGSKKTSVWLGQIDIRTSQLPSEQDNATAWPISNLYLDQPTMVAAIEMGRITGCKCYQESITRYLKEHLDSLHSITSNPLLFCLTKDYDVRTDLFSTQKSPHSFTSYTPAWEILARESPNLVRLSIKSLITECLKPNEQRSNPTLLHDTSPLSFDALIMARSMAISSLAWYSAQNPTDARPLARYATELTKLSTEEYLQLSSLSPSIQARWATALIDWSKVNQSLEMDASINFLLQPGQPVSLEPPRSSDNVTSDHKKQTLQGFSQPESEVGKKGRNTINTWLEHHVALGQASLRAWQQTNNPEFLLKAKKHGGVVASYLRKNPLSNANTETFARLIYFFDRLGDSTENGEHSRLAVQLADVAMQTFYEPRLGMFRSNQGADLCDARNGPGFLLIALLVLDGNDPTRLSSLSF